MTEETPTTGDNSVMRKDIIKEVNDELTVLENQKSEITEKIRTLKQEKIKGTLGMKVSDFNHARRLYNLEGDERREAMETMRECFVALGLTEEDMNWASKAVGDDE